MMFIDWSYNKQIISHLQFYFFITKMSMTTIKVTQLPLIKSLEEIIQESSRKNQQSVINQLQNKYRTYAAFNYKRSYKEARLKKAKIHPKKEEESSLVAQMLAKAFQSNFLLNSKEESKEKIKKVEVTQELAGIKNQKRQRFKKSNNTLFLIKHYIQKQNFKPTQQEMFLLKSLCQIKDVSEQGNLDVVLKKLYKLMNQAVDFNQLRLLCLIVMLVADLCYHYKDYSRSFFFYSQAKLYSSYTDLYEIKTQALIKMGLIAMDIKLYDESIKLLKKALQYAWKIKNNENQLYIYDHIGNVYYNQGIIKESQYYHKRFTQGQIEKNESAIKKLSIEMLIQTQFHLKTLEKKNLNSLFLEYIKLPIVSIQTISSTSLHFNKVYENYGENGQSPRKNRKEEGFQSYKQLPSVIDQISFLFKEDVQFISQIPNPDFQSNFMAIPKYGRTNKVIEFEQTAQFHKFMRKNMPKSHSKTIQVRSFQKRLQKALSEHENKQWWQQIKQKISKNRGLHVGQLRNRIFNSHESYSKYVDEKKRTISLKGERIKECFNKTLLNWIDPIK